MTTRQLRPYMYRPQSASILSRVVLALLVVHSNLPLGLATKTLEKSLNASLATKVHSYLRENNYQKPRERIVGGTEATPGAYQFFAQWLTGCGGSLIHDDIVLTAGHCMADDIFSLRQPVKIGGHVSGTGNSRRIIDYARHPRYDFTDSKAYDFMVLKLARPIPNATLVTLNSDPSYPSSDETFRVIGFGIMAEGATRTAPYLQQVDVNHIPNCQPYYNKKSQVRDSVSFCAGHLEGGKDSCTADSGGPLFDPATFLQVGLVSWGRGCARPDSPGVYARVSVVYPWLQHKICELSAVPPAHCNEIRIDIAYNQNPEEVAWALLDERGHEMTVTFRGTVQETGLQTTILQVPAGDYTFWMTDGDGSAIIGGVAIYSGRGTTEELALHNGDIRDSGELLLNIQVGGAMAAVPVAPSLANSSSQVSTPTTLVDQTENGNSTMVQSAVSTLRVEILYDMHPQETGWFLLNQDTGEEIYTLQFDGNGTVQQNVDNALTQVVEEFPGLLEGNYWFLIADSAGNGICCSHGNGNIRIVQDIIYYQTAVGKRTGYITTVEERVIFEHTGNFTDYAEAYFVL